MLAKSWHPHVQPSVRQTSGVPSAHHASVMRNVAQHSVVACVYQLLPLSGASGAFLWPDQVAHILGLVLATRSAFALCRDICGEL